MALTERRVLKQVTLLHDQDAIQVLWGDQILRDGEVISETNHRRAYTRKHIPDLLAEVDAPAPYITAMGWD